MIWVIDIIAVVVLLFACIGGFRRGLVGMASGALVILLRVAFSLALAFVILLAFQTFGAVNAVTLTFDKALGIMPVDSIGGIELGSIGNILATSIFALISFVIAYIVIAVAFRLIGKLIKKFSLNGTLGVVDRILGAIVGVAIYYLLLSIVLVFIYSFAEVGLIVYFDELLRACPIVGLLYTHNVFVKVVTDMGVAQFFLRALTGGE